MASCFGEDDDVVEDAIWGVGSLLVIVATVTALVVTLTHTHTDPAVYVTVSLTNADDAGGFDIAIGFQHLSRGSAVAHDGGHVTVSYAGVKLAEGDVNKFYVAGDRRHKWALATWAVASGEVDRAPPLSQEFRDHLWVDQQLNGAAEFDVALSFFDVNITAGQTTAARSYYNYNCKANLALHGKPTGTSNCGVASPLRRHA